MKTRLKSNRSIYMENKYWVAIESISKLLGVPVNRLLVGIIKGYVQTVVLSTCAKNKNNVELKNSNNRYGRRK